MKTTFPLVVLALALTACTTLNKDGTRTYDPVKSAAVTDGFTLIGRETISRIIRNSSIDHGEEIANYFRAIGVVFCKASATGQLSPNDVLAEIDKVTGPLQKDVDPLAITVKNVLWNLYKFFWDQKLVAQLPPEKWPAHVARVACDSIDGGLKDANKPGVPPVTQ